MLKLPKKFQDDTKHITDRLGVDSQLFTDKVKYKEAVQAAWIEHDALVRQRTQKMQMIVPDVAKKMQEDYQDLKARVDRIVYSK